jgi:hypothetical protein
LVLIPSGIKNAKVYSVKPTDGTGDLTFSRASSATRVQSDGLIEKVRTNQALQSETLDNAYWTKTNVSITANAIANPLNGALTAELLTITDPSGPVEKTITTTQTQSFTAGIPYTASAYFKAGTISTQFKILAYDGTALYQGGIIDLAIIGNSTAPYEDVGGGWYRFRFTFTPANSTSTGFVYLVNYAFGVAANAGTNVYVYGAQIETGDIATDYIATTTAAVSVGPVSGLPRLDYLGSTCPRLLLEPQRTNLVTYSEQFDNAYWSKDLGVSVAANVAISPDGYTNADRISYTSAGASIYRIVLGISTAHQFSVYLKAEGANIGKQINLESSTNINVTLTGEWQRFVTTSNDGVVAIKRLLVGQADAVLVWGAQLEAGTYATSYIPTLGASVTRVADAASKTSASALIGQTEGTIFWEFAVDVSAAAGHESIINIDNGSFGNTIYIIKSTAGTIGAEMYVGGVAQASYTSSVQAAGTHKAAIGYANNNTAFFLNGVQIGTTDTSCSVPATSRIQLGSSVFGSSTDKTAQALLFKTRLTNAQLAELTA